MTPEAMSKPTTILGMMPTMMAPEWGWAYAMTCKGDPAKGFTVGNFVRYGDYLCEITAVKDDEIQLVGLGWKNKTECRL